MDRPTATLYCTPPMIRTGIATALADAGWRVTGSDSVPPEHSNVAVVFVRSQRGVTEIRTVRRDHPEGPVVAMTDDTDADLSAAVIGAGATSVLNWDSSPEVLAAAMELTRQRISAIPTDTLEFIARHGTDTTSITDAERSWLHHLEQGITISQLAPISGYSERSLYRQLNQLYHRLGVTDRAAAIAEARRRELM